MRSKSKRERTRAVERETDRQTEKEGEKDIIYRVIDPNASLLHYYLIKSKSYHHSTLGHIQFGPTIITRH